MENIKSKLGKGGLVLAAMGLISSLLLLAWIDIWDSNMGWILRVVLILAGGALFFLHGREEADEA